MSHSLFSVCAVHWQCVSHSLSACLIHCQCLVRHLQLTHACLTAADTSLQASVSQSMGHSIGSTLRAQSPMAQSRSRSRSKSPDGLRIQTKVPNSHRGPASTGRSMSAGPRRKSASDFGSRSVNSVSESDRFDLSQISTAGPGPPAYKLRKPPGSDSPAWTFGAQSRQQQQLEQKRIGLGAGVQTKSRTPPKRRKSAGDRVGASEQLKWPTSPTLDLKRNDLLIREVGDEHTGAESPTYRMSR